MDNNELLLSVNNRKQSVLAKRTKYGISAYTFANKTQAYAAAARVTNGPSGFQVMVSAKVLGEGPFVPVRG